MSVPPALPLLESDLVRTFVAICETGSFTRAAERVFRTTSAVSMQMRRLEETLERPLFDRQGRGVRLTADGEALLGYGRRLLRLNEETVARFLGPAVEGRVRFGAPDDFGTRFLPDILARFASTHPAVEVDVVLGPSVQVLQKMADDELDLILVTDGHEESLQPGEREVLHSEPLAWAGLRGGTAQARDPLPLALAGPGCAWRRTALAALDSAGRRYRIAYTSEHCRGQMAAVRADLAIAPLPLGMIEPPFERIGAAVGLPPLGRYQILLHRSPRIGPAGIAFAEHVAASLAG